AKKSRNAGSSRRSRGTGRRRAGALRASSAVARLRERELQEGDEARPLRAQARVRRPLAVPLCERNELLAERGELLRGQVQHRVAERRGLRPFGRLLRQPLEPVERTLEVALRNDSREQLGRGLE